MPELRDIADKVRSKNAGPFWITIDIFCGNAEAFQRISENLNSGRVAAALGTPSQTLKRFDIRDLNVIKFSLPRPAIQGDVTDHDMHGAALANVVAELPVD